MRKNKRKWMAFVLAALLVLSCGVSPVYAQEAQAGQQTGTEPLELDETAVSMEDMPTEEPANTEPGGVTEEQGQTETTSENETEEQGQTEASSENETEEQGQTENSSENEAEEQTETAPSEAEPAETLQVAKAAEVSYLYYENGAWKTGSVSDYTEVTSGMDATWGGGWYVVNDNVTIESRITASGSVHLILADGYTLTVNGGIDINDGSSLSIYGQSGGTGKLTAAGSNGNGGEGGAQGGPGGAGSAGIGGENGSIIINGGEVTVNGGNGGSGGSGGAGGNGGAGGVGIGGENGTITINGGTVTATGGNGGGGGLMGYQNDAYGNGGAGGVGIGGENGTIIINGGTVTATGGIGGNGGLNNGSLSGIGGAGGVGIIGALTIENGSVTANGAAGGEGRLYTAMYGGAGICGAFTIKNGTVDATGVDGNYYGSGGAGIIGSENETVTIAGGTVTATGGSKSAGISSGESITISGGKVTAQGGENGAGIGGGNESAGGIITISGGTVMANGGNGGAGIGGGNGGEGGTITINDGTVTANGGENGAGIGGGNGGESGTITVGGGTVTANGGKNGAGIGGGNGGKGGTITINDGTVKVTGGSNAPDVGGGQQNSSYLPADKIEIGNGANVTNGSGSLPTLSPFHGINNIAWKFNAAQHWHPCGTSGCDISEHQSEKENHDWISNTDPSTGAVRKSCSICGYKENFSFTENVKYLDKDGKEKITEKAFVVDGEYTTWDSGWYVVNRNVTINSRVTVSGEVHLILADGCTLTASGGIGVNSGNSLTIYGQSDGTGKLTATGGESQAGIGGDFDSSGGSITINGGNVTATGGSGGAGIGSGDAAPISGGSGSGSGGSITINGGNVTATSGSGGAGIGGGNACEGGSITINGGKVTATGVGMGGAGIGGGGNGSGGSITINGGNVTATGGSWGAGIGSGYIGRGGSITINGGSVTATGSSGGAGIGDGSNASGSTFSTGENGNAFIIANSISDQKNKESWRGVIFEGNNGQVYKDTAIQNDAEVVVNTTLTIPEGVTLTIPKNVTFTNNGTILNYGKIIGTVLGNQPKIPAPTPRITVDSSKTTASSITVKALDKQETYGTAEYSLNGTDWQDSNVFANLHSAGHGGDNYTVYARYAGKDSYLQSEVGKMENVSTNSADYTITIPAEPVEAGNTESEAKIKPADSFDVGYGGTAAVKIKENSGVSEDGKLTLTRQDDTNTITSALFLDDAPLADIIKPLAAFRSKSDAGVTLSFAKPEEANILAGTYKGTVVFEIKYSEQ